MKAAFVAASLLLASPVIAQECQLDLPLEKELNDVMSIGGAYKALKGNDQIFRARTEFQDAIGEAAVHPDYIVLVIAPTLTGVLLIKDEKVCQGMSGPMIPGNLDMLRRIEGNAL